MESHPWEPFEIKSSEKKQKKKTEINSRHSILQKQEYREHS